MRYGAGTLAGVLVLGAFAFAQGVVDQSNDPSTDRSFTCGDPAIGNGTLGQSFRPSLSPLIGVELRLLVGSSFPSDGTTTTARIRASDGTSLGESTATVSGPRDKGTQVLVRFDFEAIDVGTDETYRIEWVSANPSVLTWMGTSGGTGGTDSYANGSAYSCVGNPWPIANTDFNFITYAEAEEETEADGPREMIEALLEQVRDLADEGAIARRTARLLEASLEAALRDLDRDRPRTAIARLHSFRNQVWFGMATRRVRLADGRDLMAAASEAIAALWESLPGNRRGWWRWF